MKKFKKIVIIFSGAAVVLCALALGVYFYAKTHNVSYDDDLTADVQHEVTVERNDQGVPLIHVSSREDLYFTLGYLHAQDRFIYMEYFRALARSEMRSLGILDDQLLDRLSRLLGFREKAAEIWKNLDVKSRSHLTAYVKGVNLALHKNIYKNKLPYDWDPEDVLAVHLLREWSQAFLSNQELMIQMAEENKNKFFRFLLQIVNPSLIHYYSEDQKDEVLMLRRLKNLVSYAMGSYNQGFAFFIPPHQAKDKRGLCGFSCQDSLSLYPGWYPVIIKIKEKDMTVVTQAGLPYIFSGDTGNFIFFSYFLNCDTQDMIQVKVKLEGGVPYYYSHGQWRPFIPVGEIGPLGEELARTDTLYRTEYGPVINDIFSEGTYDKSVITIKSLFFSAGYIQSLFEVPFSETIQQAGTWARKAVSLPRAYLFADNERSSTVYSGRVPRRQHGGSILQDSSFSWYGLDDISYYSISRGRALVGSSFIDNGPAALKRNIAINVVRQESLENLIAKPREMTVLELKTIVNDTHSALAEKFVPQFLAMLQSNPITSARLTRVYFNEWSRNMNPARVAPTIFSKLLRTFVFNTLSDDFGDDIQTVMENQVYIMDGFFAEARRGSSLIFDDTATYDIETRDTIFDRSFLDTLRVLNRTKGPVMNDWKWGAFSKGHFRIPFSQKSFISDIIYTIEDRAIPGCFSGVYYNKTDDSLQPLEISSLRGFYYLGKSQMTMNCGYCLNPLSRLYYGKVSEVELDDSRAFNMVNKIIFRAQ